MAVYKRSYRGYAGRLTAIWSRFLILPRFAYKSLFHSKLLTAFFVACFFFPVACAGAIYLNHNLRLLTMLHLPGSQLFDVDGTFFFYFLQVQGVLAFFLTALVGPGLVSPDLANNGLALYLCRPFSRAEYVLGKMSVLGFLLSCITWLPGLILFLIQSGLAEDGWMRANLWIAGAIVLGSCFRILVFSVLALALSAWIKWRVVAGALLLGVFFIGAGFAQAINAVLETHNGTLIDLVSLIAMIERSLFRQQPYQHTGLSVNTSWLALFVICCFCLILLERKVRAYEVVRG